MTRMKTKGIPALRESATERRGYAPGRERRVRKRLPPKSCARCNGRLDAVLQEIVRLVADRAGFALESTLSALGGTRRRPRRGLDQTSSAALPAGGHFERAYRPLAACAAGRGASTRTTPGFRRGPGWVSPSF